MLRRRYRVEGPSMEPTHPPGSRVRVMSLQGEPRRGDIVVLRPPATPRRLDLKRVVGLPGEMVSWGRGEFRVNGSPLAEPYARSPPAPPGDDEVQAWRLGPDEYFVMGDNRLHSTDSRHHGPVKRDRIAGKATDA
ncbi:MAG: signal peptidase I [Euryarchaeota archaeon]|nr:signal peptidase I [Euryarchaeota archaeon]